MTRLFSSGAIFALALTLAACTNTRREVHQYPAPESAAPREHSDPAQIQESVITAVPGAQGTQKSQPVASTRRAVNTNLKLSLADTAKPVRPDTTAKRVYPTVWAHLAAEMEFTDLTSHKDVESVEEWYAKHSYYLSKLGKRAGLYLYYILDRAKAKGMPADLALLPLVESAYDPFAYSHGQAAGLWQFIPQTARHVGLKQDWWYDARRDVVSSTDAALNYLADLNKRFDGDWLLTLAAYNSGAGTVNRAMAKNQKKGLPTDFWSLKLPKETTRYVPKLLAMVTIFKNPASFNVSLPDISDEPHFAIVNTGGQIDLQQAANLAGIGLDELYPLNPGLNRGVTPPTGPHRLLVPQDSADVFRTRLAQMPVDARVRWRHYTVKRGDNLGAIARANHIDVAVLKSTNKLKNDVIRVGQELMIPGSDDALYAFARSGDSGNQRQVYTVRSGDTLSQIGKRYGVSVAQLRRWNHLGRNSLIKVGQKLELWSEPGSRDGIVRKVGYRVRNGDSLSQIASRFNIKISDIVEWNSINPKKYLRPGQALTLFVDITRADL